jgi:glycosyltransferase involved in cell wall biosynthesis
MDISVVIPAFGREELLIRCLNALEHDASGLTCELCVVDDGSGLDEDSVRQRMGSSCPLVWTAFDAPRGRSAARNAGIRASSGRLVVLLDSDMEVQPGFLAAHAAFHQTHPRMAAVGTIIWPRGGSFRRYIGSRGVAKLKSGDHVPPWYFVTGNASLERTDLPPDELFDETLTGWGGEDLDLGMRLARSGIGFGVVGNAKAFHHFEGTLAEHLHRTRSYGMTALPVLTKRYPELLTVTRLDRLASPVIRFMIHSVPFHMAALLANLFDPLPIPDMFFDYLTFAAYARGWRGNKS